MNPEPVNRKRNPSFHFIPVSHHQIHWFLDQPIPNLHQQLTQLPENQKLGQLRIRPRLHNRINRNRSKKKYKKYKKKKERKKERKKVRKKESKKESKKDRKMER